MKMIFHSHANKTHFHKKGCALGLILKVRVFGTWKWPIEFIENVTGFFPQGQSKLPVCGVFIMRVSVKWGLTISVS